MITLDAVTDIHIENLQPLDYIDAFIDDAWWADLEVPLSSDECSILQDALGDQFFELAHEEYKANYDEEIDQIRWYHYT